MSASRDGWRCTHIRRSRAAGGGGRGCSRWATAHSRSSPACACSSGPTMRQSALQPAVKAPTGGRCPPGAGANPPIARNADGWSSRSASAAGVFLLRRRGNRPSRRASAPSRRAPVSWRLILRSRRGCSTGGRRGDGVCLCRRRRRGLRVRLLAEGMAVPVTLLLCGDGVRRRSRACSNTCGHAVGAASGVRRDDRHRQVALGSEALAVPIWWAYAIIVLITGGIVLRPRVWCRSAHPSVSTMPAG